MQARYDMNAAGAAGKNVSQNWSVRRSRRAGRNQIRLGRIGEVREQEGDRGPAAAVSFVHGVEAVVWLAGWLGGELRREGHFRGRIRRPAAPGSPACAGGWVGWGGRRGEAAGTQRIMLGASAGAG